MIKKFPTKRTPPTALGLALDGNRLAGAVVRRSNGSLRVLKTFTATLAVNPLNTEAALVGREIRNHLEQAGIKEKNCVFCVPLGWALSMQTKVPNMPESDLQSFLDIEAERGFPYAPETLTFGGSICGAAGDGEKHATLVAVPKNHLLQLERAIRAAQLRPLSFTLGVTALHGAERDSQQGVLTLAVGENSVDLQITINGGVASLRSLDSAIEIEGSQKSIDAEALAREVRVTLGQLPMELRGSVRTALIFGSSDLAQRLAHDIAPLLQTMRMSVDWQRAYSSDAFRSQYPPNTPIAPELSAAARFLTGAGSTFELLPPKVSAWQQITARVSSKKLGWVGVAAAGILLIAGGAMGAQLWKLSKLQKEWASMEKQVRGVDDMQAKIRKYRPWFDESLPSLSILKRVTDAFPVEGTVWTKTVEIRNQTAVICTGTARNNEALMKTLDQLRASSEVSDLRVDSVRGTPLQFTFNFQFSPGEAAMKIDNRQQALAIAVIVLISLLLLDQIVVRPLTASWKARSERIAKLQKSINDGKATLNRSTFIRSRWDQMQTNTLSADNAESRLLEAFQRWSRASNISVSSIQPQWKRGDDNYMTLECHANAFGPVKAMAQFLYNIEKDPMALRIEGVEIQARDESGQNLAVNLQVSGLVLGNFAQ